MITENQFIEKVVEAINDFYYMAHRESRIESVIAELGDFLARNESVLETFYGSGQDAIRASRLIEKTIDGAYTEVENESVWRKSWHIDMENGYVQTDSAADYDEYSSGVFLFDARDAKGKLGFEDDEEQHEEKADAWNAARIEEVFGITYASCMEKWNTIKSENE